MSLPHNLMPERSEPQPEAQQSTSAFRPIEPGWVTPLAPAISPSAEGRFPSWSLWDVLAVLAFTVFAVFGFSVIALFIARSLPQYRHAPMSELATNALIVVGAQAAAYPIVLLFIFLIVRSRSREQFRKAIHWNWPGLSAPVSERKRSKSESEKCLRMPSRREAK